MTAGDYIALVLMGLSASGCAFAAGQGGWNAKSNLVINAEHTTALSWTEKKWWPGPAICLIVSLAFIAASVVYCAVRF